MEMFSNMKGRESKRIYAKFIEILNSGTRTYNQKVDGIIQGEVGDIEKENKSTGAVVNF